MLSMLHVALAKSSRDVGQACASKVTGVYDINRHMYLRRTFVAVHVRDDATIVDGHKHFVEAGGWSERAVFVKYLRSPKKGGRASSAVRFGQQRTWEAETEVPAPKAEAVCCAPGHASCASIADHGAREGAQHRA